MDAYGYSENAATPQLRSETQRHDVGLEAQDLRNESMAELVQNDQTRQHEAGCQKRYDGSDAAQLAAAEVMDEKQRYKNDVERTKQIPQIVRARLEQQAADAS
jgi:hypothetical protein